MILFSHPTGNANVRAALKGINEANLLQSFYTTIATYPGNTFDSISQFGPLNEFKRRSYSPELEPLTRVRPWKEMARVAAKKGGLNSLVKHEHGTFSVDAIYHDLDRYVAKSLKREEPDAVYAYEDGALASFRKAKASNIQCLYDLPIGYWRAARKLLKQVVLDRPEWSMTIAGMSDSDEKLTRKDEEIRLADHIFVASSFTRKTLEEFPGELPPIEVIPYGFPSPVDSREYESLKSRPLRLLFVGGLSQRKGIAEMFEAVENLGSAVSLTVVGGKPSGDSCEALNVALSKHTYIPSLPHDKVLELMRQHDLFLFPSHFEGFGLVITEAMSQGTPVIATDRTAAPDLITHGEDGYLIEAGSSKDLEKQILSIINDPDSIERVGRAAMHRASKRPWEVYGRELADAISRVSQK